MWRGSCLFLQQHLISCCSHSSLPMAHMLPTPPHCGGSVHAVPSAQTTTTILHHPLMCNHFSCRSSITVTGSEKSLLTSPSTQIPFSLPFRCSIHYCPCLPVSSPTPSQRSPTHTPRELVTANTCASVPDRVCLSTGHPPRHAGWRGRDRSAWRETRLTLGAMI